MSTPRALGLIALAAACGRYDLGGFGDVDGDATIGGAVSGSRGAEPRGGRARGGAPSAAGHGGVVSSGGAFGGAATGNPSGGTTGHGGNSLQAGAGGDAGDGGAASGGAAQAGAGSGAGAGAVAGAGSDSGGGAGAAGHGGGDTVAGGSAGGGGVAGVGGEGGRPGAARSCSLLDIPCGTEGDSCCTALGVPSGDFAFTRASDPNAVDSHVSAFFLDRYEVTVARFRAFIDDYDAFLARGGLEAGAGVHPLVPGSGWNPAWQAPDETEPDLLGPDAESLRAAVSSCMGIPFSTLIALQPINCVSWFEAQAFCIWDGGRLPTELEWEYAAAGGDEERAYPWGAAAPTHDLAFYDCSWVRPGARCDIPPVGSFSDGAGRWSHLDLAGSVWEWTFDVFSTLPRALPCNDCADVAELWQDNPRGVRGGGWESSEMSLATGHRSGLPARIRLPYHGFRCAYDPR